MYKVPLNAKTIYRRDFLKLGSGFAALAAFPLLSAGKIGIKESKMGNTSAALPIIDARFPCRIAKGIWLIPDKRIPLVPNIGIVEGDHSVLVIDCGINEVCGGAVLEAAKTIAGKRELILTVTHAHPEHTFGCQAFQGKARIFYNELQRDYLAKNGSKLLQGFRQILGPERSWLLDNIKVTAADDIYSGSGTVIDLGNRKVVFQTWGKAHSPGDQVISIPDEGVLFAGDLIEERKFPIVPYYPPLIEGTDIDLNQWELALQDMAAQRHRIIVPGHGNIGSREIITAVQDYFTQIKKLAGNHRKDKITKAQLVKSLEQTIKAQYPTWEQDEFIAPAVEYLLSES